MNFINRLSKSNVAEPCSSGFLRYVSIWTTSDSVAADKGIQPSTEQQRIFAEMLAKELKSIGVFDATVTNHAYVCARIPQLLFRKSSVNLFPCTHGYGRRG